MKDSNFVISAAADTSLFNDPAEFEAALAILPEFRRAAAMRYRFPEDRRLSAGAWLLLYSVTSSLGVDISDKLFSYSACGKPYFSGADFPYFSLSHSGTYVMCSVSDHPVGCDIERIGRRFLNVSDRFFTDDERRQIAEAKALNKDVETFFRLWTLKESFMKLTGLGFRLPLSEFSFDISGDTPELYWPCSEDSCVFYESGSIAGYRCAAASKDSLFTELKTVDLKDVIH